MKKCNNKQPNSTKYIYWNNSKLKTNVEVLLKNGGGAVEEGDKVGI